MVLSLGYYTNSFLQYFAMESLISHSLIWHFQNSDSSDIKLDTIIKENDFFCAVLRNEFIKRDQRPYIDILHERLDQLQDADEILIDREKNLIAMKNPNIFTHLASVAQDEKTENFSLCHMFYSMTSCIDDTYTIVLMAIQSIC